MKWQRDDRHSLTWSTISSAVPSTTVKIFVGARRLLGKRWISYTVSFWISSSVFNFSGFLLFSSLITRDQMLFRSSFSFLRRYDRSNFQGHWWITQLSLSFVDQSTNHRASSSPSYLIFNPNWTTNQSWTTVLYHFNSIGKFFFWFPQSFVFSLTERFFWIFVGFVLCIDCRFFNFNENNENQCRAKKRFIRLESSAISFWKRTNDQNRKDEELITFSTSI